MSRFSSTILIAAASCLPILGFSPARAEVPAEAASPQSVAPADGQNLQRPPLPPPPMVQTPAPRGTGIAKPPLSWRTRATRMDADPAARAISGRSILANPSDTLMAILTACPLCGLKVTSVDSAAGRVVAVALDSGQENVRLTITLKATGVDRTAVKVTAAPESVEVQSIVTSLLSRVAEDVSLRNST